MTKKLKIILFIFAVFLIGTGVFYFLNIQKKESAQTQTAQNLKLLTSHSSPKAGEKWAVSFETKGIGDLTIIPEDPDTVGDLDFVSLKCGEEERTPQILENDAIFYPNWSCDGTGEITHLVNVAKNHVLKSQFGHQIAYAYNSPGVVPQGTIALWSGTIASIPANWYLCDGNNGTPNLVARFVRGAPAATDPGTTGGSDTHTHTTTAAGTHTHTLNTNAVHGHTTNAGGTHNHTLDIENNSAGTGAVVMRGSAGSHTHTVNNNSVGHSHTCDTDPNHTHTINTADSRPPYYEIAYIWAGAGAEITTGIIIIWSGTLASIPDGWALCNGTGSPDLRSKFIRGVATGATNPGATGGSTTHTHTVVARDHNHGTSNSAGSHFHTFNAYTWTHSHNLSAGTSVDNYKQSDTGGGNHTHSNTDTIGNTTHTVGTGGSHTHTNDATASLSLPAYYTVAWIISTGATTVPTNGILIWTGLLVNIPANYNLCDGASGRPELRGKFLYGAVAGNDPGGTGGSDTHLHTEAGDSAAHTDHAVALDAGHTHTVSATTGAHTHSQVQEGGWGTTAKWSINASGGDHTHTFTATTHNDHTVSSVAGHNHEPWVNADTRPAYYEVAFISAPESNAAPTVSSVSLNADTSFSPVESTIKSANVTGQVIDSDGCSDVTYITALAYRSGVSSTCSANDNNCYRGITCSTSCSGTTVSCTCAASIWFHADPTDAGTYVAQYWQGAILATDSASNTVLGASTNTTVDLNTLLALDVTTSIAYGSLSPGADTGATNQNVTVTATGNAAIDCSVKGTDMTGGVGGTILASKQKYDLAAFTYSTGGTAFTAKNTDAALELVCAKPSTHPSDSTDIIYWGLGVDNGTPAAADYSGTNTFTVTPE